MSYKLLIEEGPGYVHARLRGERTAENAIRGLKGAFAACVKRNVTDLLMEMRWSGPALDNREILRVISDRSGDGAKLRRIAYVEAFPAEDPQGARMAETLAANRGVNVRLFRDIETAKRWLSEGG